MTQPKATETLKRSKRPKRPLEDGKELPALAFTKTTGQKNRILASLPFDFSPQRPLNSGERQA